MSSWIKIFSLIFFLNYVVTDHTDSIVEYTFHVVSLGHSGLLITWNNQRKNIPLYHFAFNVYIAGEENEGNSKSNNSQSPSVSEKNHLCSTQNRYIQCENFWGSYKIHSLNESTLYELIIEQYKALSVVRKYSMKIKTSSKSQRKPSKPDFEYLNSFDGSVYFVRWYPCGRERICEDQESGTHFGVKIKELYNVRKMGEAEEEEFHADFKKVFLLPGRVYEIVVYSINGECKTYSDSQEISLDPVFSSVQRVKIIPLPDLSVLISWEPPKYELNEEVSQYLLFTIQHFDEPSTTVERDIIFYEDKDSFKLSYTTPHDSGVFMNDRKQMRIFNHSLGVMYTYMLISRGLEGMGIEYWMRREVQAYNHDLPISKPGFDYKLKRRSMKNTCSFSFQWLPCGQSFDCKNSKPGSEYFFKFKPEPESGYYDQERGGIWGDFYLDLLYKVSLKSSIGGNFSKSVTKKFKNCSAI